ncbi:hypothetical protein AB0M86_42425 [Streptomyces sp. NPDC051639]|uniref:hypothetical protein n=1 Tax=Streptomyces sp. NPDC051639 TaxID=3155671 RepID=UPI0034280D1A
MNTRRWISGLALPLVAGAAVTLVPATAQAAPQAGTVTLCANGSFSFELEWTTDGLETGLVSPGHCSTFNSPGGVREVNVIASAGPALWYVGSFQLDGGRNVKVTAVDTASGASYYVA